MMISKENYEAYFLDYIEGNLSQKDTDMLLLFLDKNPNLKDELAEYSEISLITPVTNFDKTLLLQVNFDNDKINTYNIEEFAIADFENELSNNKSSELKSFINNNPVHQKDVDLVNKTSLLADESIVYEKKEDLKKTIPLFIPYYRIAGIAAIILLMIYFYIPGNQTTVNSQLATSDEQSTVNNFQSTTLKTKIENSKKLDVIEKAIKNVEPEVRKKQLAALSTHTSEYNKPLIKNVNTRHIDVSKQIKSNRVLASAIPITRIDNFYDENDKFYVDKNKYLSPKEFLASILKKDVLNSKSNVAKIEAEDFNSTLASITNDKVSFKKSSNNTRLISIQTKNFSFEKKIRN